MFKETFSPFELGITLHPRSGLLGTNYWSPVTRTTFGLSSLSVPPRGLSVLCQPPDSFFIPSSLTPVSPRTVVLLVQGSSNTTWTAEGTPEGVGLTRRKSLRMYETGPLLSRGRWGITPRRRLSPSLLFSFYDPQVVGSTYTTSVSQVNLSVGLSPTSDYQTSFFVVGSCFSLRPGTFDLK